MALAAWALMLAIAAAPPVLAQSRSTAASASQDAAVAALTRGDFATALKVLRPLAEQGNAGAQSNLGLMYYDGQGVAQSHAEAARWFGQAATQGDSRAQSNLAAMYYDGQGVAQSYAEAARWYRLSVVRTFGATRGVD